MSMTLNERVPHISVIPIGSRASSAALVVPGLYFRKHSRIKNVYYVDGANVSKSNSNYLSFALQDNASSPVVYAASSTSDAAVVANTQYPLALSTPVGDVTNQPEADVPAGTQLTVSLTGIGTSVTTNAVLLVEWYPL